MHANHGSTNKSSKMLNAAENKLTRWFVDKWWKSHKAKTPPSDFKVTTSKNPLINNQAVTSIMNLTNYPAIQAYPKISTYSWTFAPIPNWTWSCSSHFSLDAQTSNLWLTLCTDPSTWLIPVTWMVVGYKILHFINNENQESTWLQNPTAYKTQ